MKIDTKKLITISNYAKLKNLTRQHVYRLVLSSEINEIKIDDVSFIYLDDKALSFERKRKTKIKNE
jgi:hypothetical protein